MLLAFTSSVLYAQSQAFGFGCLGFVSGYGGYSYQVYKPDGLNGYIAVLNDTRKDSLIFPILGEFSWIQADSEFFL